MMEGYRYKFVSRGSNHEQHASVAALYSTSTLLKNRYYLLAERCVVPSPSKRQFTDDLQSVRLACASYI